MDAHGRPAHGGDVLLRAAHGPHGQPPLPDDIVALLRGVAAPARLAAHLCLVRAVAVRLLDWLAAEMPAVDVDREAVLFGAGTHDIGKVAHPAELSGPGSAHEEAGRALLLDHGYPPHLARFAATHGTWTPSTPLDDLLVSLADKAWKGARVDDLEQLVVTTLARDSSRPEWDVLMVLDDILTTVGDDADARVRWQGAFPAR